MRLDISWLRGACGDARAQGTCVKGAGADAAHGHAFCTVLPSMLRMVRALDAPSLGSVHPRGHFTWSHRGGIGAYQAERNIEGKSAHRKLDSRPGSQEPSSLEDEIRRPNRRGSPARPRRDAAPAAIDGEKDADKAKDGTRDRRARSPTPDKAAPTRPPYHLTPYTMYHIV